jgi:hypothetical protein
VVLLGRGRNGFVQIKPNLRTLGTSRDGSRNNIIRVIKSLRAYATGG